MKKNRDVALILLKNNEGKFLFQLRDKGIDCLSEHWGLFGGGVEVDESFDAAVRRETYEELQYTLQNPVLLLEHDYELRVQKKNRYGKYVLFIERYDNSKKLVQCEGQNMSWFTLDEVQNKKMWEFDKESLRIIKEKAEAF